jgi:4-carboxymuconolactone decarboxylase
MDSTTARTISRSSAIWGKPPGALGEVLGLLHDRLADGALTEREKALIALAVAHTAVSLLHRRVHERLPKGVLTSIMTEAVHVATAIRGGASLVHGVQMRNIAQKVGM